jgi:cytochrome c biogenesis protein ResB
VKVDAAEPLMATVLQVSHAPGRLVVYAGMACLAAGVILLVLVPERRVWVRAAPQAGRIVVALAAHRAGPEAGAELEQVVAALAPHWTKPERRTS